jgi:hypothetical protein
VHSLLVCLFCLFVGLTRSDACPFNVGLTRSDACHLRALTGPTLSYPSTHSWTRYLLKREIVLALLERMVAEDGDTMARQNILGALQKLSLRRKAQSYMIDLGAISWLHQALTHRSELCEYSEEYAVALIMNLCLRSAGRRFCESSCLGVVDLLKDMLTHESDQVRTCIHGALFTLLGNRALRERAVSIGIEAAIHDRIATSSEEMGTQVRTAQPPALHAITLYSLPNNFPRILSSPEGRNPLYDTASSKHMQQCHARPYNFLLCCVFISSRFFFDACWIHCRSWTTF